MHIEPCAKASSSSSPVTRRRSSAIWERVISRPRTTLVAPSRAYSSAARALMTLACVETWMATWGANSRASEIAARSAAMTASTPMSSRRLRNAGSSSTSRSRITVLTVTCTRTPCRWAYATARARPSSSKLAARDRMPQRLPARYTLSAPKWMASASCSGPPAGERSSIPTRAPARGGESAGSPRHSGRTPSGQPGCRWSPRTCRPGTQPRLSPPAPASWRIPGRGRA